jgi:hypothetical protein
MLKNGEDFAGLSNLSKEEWQQELATQIALSYKHITEERRAQEGQTITFKTSDGKTFSGVANEKGNITSNGYTYTGVHQNEEGEWVTSEKSKG